MSLFDRPLAAEIAFPTSAAHEPERVPVEDLQMLPPAGGKRWAKLRDGRHLRLERTRPALESANPWHRHLVAVVATHRTEDTRFGRVGGGHRFTERHEFTEATVHTEAAYRSAIAADKAAAERAARKANPRPAPILLGPDVASVRARLDQLGVKVERVGGHVLVTATGRLLNTDRDLLRAYAPLLADPGTTCARCKTPASYMAMVDVPLCAGHAGKAER